MKEPILDFYDTELFGSEDAESEDPEVLASYFVEKPSFQPFHNASKKLAIIRARKGMGKSALLAKVAHDVQKNDPSALVIAVHGADLVALADLTVQDPLILINHWQDAICKRIVREIGARLRIAISDSAMAMVEAAQLSGARGRNLVGALIDRIKTPVGPISFDRPSAPESQSLLRAFEARHNDLNVWLLVDDVDATFLNTDLQRLRVSTFFSAARKMAHDFNGIKLRVSVRTDVWMTVVRADEATDKCEQYVTDLSWTRHETRRILLKKIHAYVQRRFPDYPATKRWTLEENSNQILGLAFAESMEWGGERYPPDRLIHVLSAGRPRWSAQLCRLAGRDAAMRRSNKISVEDIDNVLKRFGKLRLDDIHREHAHQFSDIQGLTEAFAGGKIVYYTPELLEIIWENYIQKCGGINQVPPLDGHTVSRPLDLAHFLYRIGFISGRERDDQDDLSFIRFEERPDLLSNVINPDDGLRWDVHPSYRKHLGIHRRGTSLGTAAAPNSAAPADQQAPLPGR